MRKALLPILLGITLAGCTTNSEVRSLVKDKEWRSIFNEKDLRGWEKVGNFQTEVKGGALYISAAETNENAWLLTSRTYRNFDLELEFLMDKETDSGILFRYDPSQSGLPNTLGYEANLLWNTDTQNPLGSILFHARAKTLPDLLQDQWNQIAIKARGDHLSISINGVKIAETHSRASMSGRIGIQVPGKRGQNIAVRKMRIRELADTRISSPQLEQLYRNAATNDLEPIIAYETLDDWQNLNGGKWKLNSDGVLHGFSDDQNSFFVTKNSYRNFYLQLKFKIKKEDNSGIFIRKHPDSTNVSLNDAIECNIYDHNGFEHAYSTGSIANFARAWSHLVDYSDWNSMEIFARDNHIIMYVNGQKSSEVHLPEKYNKAGNICLQAGPRFFSDRKSSHVYFKDILIKNMDRP